MYKKIILICGMPRSGTSWLGQIINSSPSVAFRMEPLFSYRFKNAINEKSSKADIARFFTEVYRTDDDFIRQNENRSKGIYRSFKKDSRPEFLVIKTTRHHHLLQGYLKSINCIDVISIIRHPCAVINSWINTEREFKAKGCTIDNDWRSGRCRKDGDGEFWGFDDWLSVTRQHMELGEKYSNFNIVLYADLIHKTEHAVKVLFKQLSIPYEGQTAVFLEDCHRRHDDNPYSVFKNTAVENKWKTELNNSIAQEIIKETTASGLGGFIK